VNVMHTYTHVQLIPVLNHADHGLQEMKLVILRPVEPGPDMRVMMSSHKASENMSYLHGSPFVVEVCAVSSFSSLPVDVV